MSSPPTSDDAWRILAGVADPELPMLNIVELGIVRSVAVCGEQVRVAITPTFTACPAMRAIERDLAASLTAAGFARVDVDTVLAPAWTTDWMTASARATLKQHGIAPPIAAAVASLPGSRIAAAQKPACPRCDAADVERISEFGSTPCKALYRCSSCLETFEYFKCH